MEWAQAHRRQNTRVRLRAGECAWQACAVTCDVRIQVQCSWHQAQRSGEGWGESSRRSLAGGRLGSFNVAGVCTVASLRMLCTVVAVHPQGTAWRVEDSAASETRLHCGSDVIQHTISDRWERVCVCLGVHRRESGRVSGCGARSGEGLKALRLAGSSVQMQLSADMEHLLLATIAPSGAYLDAQRVSSWATPSSQESNLCSCPTKRRLHPDP